MEQLNDTIPAMISIVMPKQISKMKSVHMYDCRVEIIEDHFVK